jgi:hypothetical protein
MNAALPRPLSEPERIALVDACRRYSPARVAAAVGVCRHTLLVAAAGLDLPRDVAHGLSQRLSVLPGPTGPEHVGAVLGRVMAELAPDGDEGGAS